METNKIPDRRTMPRAQKAPDGRLTWKADEVGAWLVDSMARREPDSQRRPGRPKGSVNKKRRVEQIAAAKAKLRQGGA